ncbi:MAG: hypothetical protein R2820_13875 [Cyclobacteriaceae bacterium]|nr:hypothetical protein [Cyclobacteriaceae bacterium]
MRIPTRLFLLCLVATADIAVAQSKLPEFSQATFWLPDSSTVTGVVNQKLLLTRNTLQFQSEPSQRLRLADVRSFVIDSTQYFVKQISNAEDTLKVMERIIEGKISFYASPKLSTTGEMFAEKGDILYELKTVKKDVNGRTFKVKEYRSYLLNLMVDCEAIDKVKLTNDLAYNFPTFVKLITQYNENCGWQSEIIGTRDLEATLELSAIAGVFLANNKLDYVHTTRVYSGKTSLVGFSVGGSAAISFRKFRDTRATLDLVLDKVSGDAYATANRPTLDQIHYYDIMRLKTIIGFDVAVKHWEHASLLLGAGTIFQFQLSNNSTWKYEPVRTNINPIPFQTGKDKFSLMPQGFVQYDTHKYGIRFQLVPLAVQMRYTDVIGFEKRLAFYYHFRK